MQSLCKSFHYSLGITALFIASTISASGSALQHRVEDLAYGQALFQYFQQNELRPGLWPGIVSLFSE